MSFLRYTVRILVITGFAAFLVSLLCSIINLVDGSARNLMEALQFFAQAGMMLGIGLIAEILLLNHKNA